ncbi:MAG: hypothetical protein FWC79_04475 [Oscillospiraceae bacterium]|nr:hypothetical protein [Oscillospiraceae bacterium]
MNKGITHVNCPLTCNDVIEIDMDFEEDNSNIAATNISLDIIYEDPYYLVINKPSNIAIHPSPQHYDTSLSNGVKYYFDSTRAKENDTSC